MTTPGDILRYRRRDLIESAERDEKIAQNWEANAKGRRASAAKSRTEHAEMGLAIIALEGADGPAARKGFTLMTPTDNLAAAARKLCVARAGEGYDTLEHELAHALDDYDQQEILKIEIRSRVSDRQLMEVFSEELVPLLRARQHGAHLHAPPISDAEMAEQAALQAMRRVANYAEHLVKAMTLLTQGTDLWSLLTVEALEAGKLNEHPGPNFDDPRIRKLGEAIAIILSETNASRPPAKPEDPVALPLGHA